jgi:Xaa-Pro aminopeptidase
MKQLIRSVGALVLIHVLLCIAASQDLKNVDYDVDWLPPSFHKTMRDSIRAKIGKDAVAIFYSAPERMRNADVEYRYRQDDNFYYLTGFREPNAVLVLLPDGSNFRLEGDTAQVTANEVLYLQPRNPMFERWTGRRYGQIGRAHV